MASMDGEQTTTTTALQVQQLQQRYFCAARPPKQHARYGGVWVDLQQQLGRTAQWVAAAGRAASGACRAARYSASS